MNSTETKPLPPGRRVLFPSDRIAERTGELVGKITRRCGRDNLVFIGILRGSFMFLADLVRVLHERGLRPRIDFITLESYHGGTESSGIVRITKDLSVDVRGAQVVLVDDILDTGRTLQFACKHLLNKGAQSVLTCVLLDKPARRVVDIEPDFKGFDIEDVFVVGYGLDADSYYRELPYIAELVPDKTDAGT